MATHHFGPIRSLTIEKGICINRFLMLPKHCADLYIVYAAITLSGKEIFILYSFENKDQNCQLDFHKNW